MKILLTGFQPFGGELQNPSAEAVSLVPDTIAGAEVVKAVLPVSYAAAETMLISLLDTIRPALALCTGQAGGRPVPMFEMLAVNIDESESPDNDGAVRCGTSVTDGGVQAYFSNLPVRAMTEGAHAAGLPCAVSWDAGRFVCNHVFYRLMEWIESGGNVAAGGFLHLPYSCGQVAGKKAAPCMNLNDMALVISAALETAAARMTGRD